MAPGQGGTPIVDASALIPSIPGWLQSPSWFDPLARGLGTFVRDHQALGLFLVIFAEEIGVPLPAPGDVAVAYGGFLTERGVIPLPGAYCAVIAGATVGSFVLWSLSRRFGRPFVERFGGYIGLDATRLEVAERVFRRWGPLAIIVGRQVPGMRIVMSAFAGIFGIPARVFVPCVMVSSAIWAAIFLTLGRVLGHHIRFLFRLLPLHLVPLLVLLLVVVALLYYAYEHGVRSRALARRRAREKKKVLTRGNLSQ